LSGVSPSRESQRVDDLVAFAPLGGECRHDLRRILQVGVHHDHRVARRVIHARRDRDLMAEVARQGEIAIARIVLGLAGGDDAGRVAAAVVDEDDLGRRVEGLHQAVKPMQEQRQHRLFVVERDDQAVDDGSCALVHGKPGRRSARRSASRAGG